MSEEEKKAIEIIKSLACYYDDDCLLDDEEIKENEEVNSSINMVVGLIEKQRKEIEELKEKNKTLETLLQGTLYERYLYYKDLASKYQANSISKDKIREKIKELEKEVFKSIAISEKINILKELLEEN